MKALLLTLNQKEISSQECKKGVSTIAQIMNTQLKWSEKANVKKSRKNPWKKEIKKIGHCMFYVSQLWYSF